MPQLTAELIDLVAIPSFSEPGFDAAREAWPAAWGAERVTLAEADMLGGLAAVCGGGKH